ncbi:hypothetical protein Tco_0568155 [Tanacetum coccineum]
MNFTDPSTSLLAASVGDTMRLFYVSKDPDLAVASAGDDKKISCGERLARIWGPFLPSGLIAAVTILRSVTNELKIWSRSNGMAGIAI